MKNWIACIGGDISHECVSCRVRLGRLNHALAYEPAPIFTTYACSTECAKEYDSRTPSLQRWGRQMKQGQRVIVTDPDHPMHGVSGVVRRKRMADQGAWVEMDQEPPDSVRAFPSDDEGGRGRHILLYPDQCKDHHRGGRRMSDEGSKLRALDILPRNEAATKDVIATLEDAIAFARTNGAVGVLVVVESDSQTTMTSWTGVYDGFTKRLGAIEAIKMDWYARVQSREG